MSAWGLGEYAEVERLGRESLDLFAAIGHRWGVPAGHCRIGFAQLARERYREARTSFETGLRLAANSHLPSLELYALGIAGVLAREGHAERAAGILLFALSHPATPEDYKVIVRRELAAIERQLPLEALAEDARSPSERTLEDLANSVFRQPAAAPA